MHLVLSHPIYFGSSSGPHTWRKKKRKNFGSVSSIGMYYLWQYLVYTNLPIERTAILQVVGLDETNSFTAYDVVLRVL